MRNSVVLFFIDGLGIGTRGDHNPFYLLDGLEPLGHFVDEKNDIINDGILIPTDASLGVEGRPQSASGQTTIYTGINAPKLLGHHKQGFPNQKLKDVIKQHSIFLQLKNKGISETIFANTYTPKFFKKTPRWKSATTCSVEAADMRFCRITDLLGRKSIYHDFTNKFLIENGFKVPEYSPNDAAEILSDLSKDYDFTLYEHFITDKIGHEQDFNWAERHLPQLSLFIRKTLEKLNLEETTFILTSDHGNIENLAIRNHTLNKVPTIVWGKNKEKFAKQITDLSNITPAILKLFN